MRLRTSVVGPNKKGLLFWHGMCGNLTPHRLAAYELSNCTDHTTPHDRPPGSGDDSYGWPRRRSYRVKDYCRINKCFIDAGQISEVCRTTPQTNHAVTGIQPELALERCGQGRLWTVAGPQLTAAHSSRGGGAGRLPSHRLIEPVLRRCRCLGPPSPEWVGRARPLQ